MHFFTEGLIVTDDTLSTLIASDEQYGLLDSSVWESWVSRDRKALPRVTFEAIITMTERSRNSFKYLTESL